MNYQLLGAHTGLRVSSLALGTARLGTEGGKVLRAFAEAGGNFVDTSSAYQLGRCEEMVGTLLADVKREDLVIASKYGRTASATPSEAAAGSHRKAMRSEVEASLRRLGTDHLDVYFVHFDDGLTPIDEIMRGLDDLVRAGKVVYVGLSNFSAWRLASAAMLAEVRGWAPLAALQVQYNLLERDLDREHLPFAQARGLGVMAYSPLAGGRLGKPASTEDGEADRRVFQALDDVATEIGCAPSAVAMAWVGARGLIPVLGPRNLEQLQASLATSSVQLNKEHLTKLDEASARPLGHPYELLQKVRSASGYGQETYPQSGRVL